MSCSITALKDASLIKLVPSESGLIARQDCRPGQPIAIDLFSRRGPRYATASCFAHCGEIAGATPPKPVMF
jgi:hypothetical protein